MSKSAHEVLAWSFLLHSFLFTVFLVNDSEVINVITVIAMIYIAMFQISVIANEIADRDEVKNVNNRKN